MKLRTSLAASAIVLAVAPVAARAQQVLFSDNFDDGAAAGRYDLFHVDNDSNLDFLDTSSNFAFDYSTYTYERDDGLGGIASAPIPSAPNSGGTTTGLRFSVNENDPPGSAIINAYPKVSQFVGGVVPSGDYSLKFDMWMNYNGFREGGSGSTHFMIAGIKQQGEGIGGPVVGPGPFPTQTGYAMAVSGERGTTQDYLLYKDNDRLTNYAAAGYIAQPEVVGTATVQPDAGENSFYQTLFPEPQYETGGAPGKNWVTVEISHIDGQLTYKMNGTTIATRQDTSLESGNILLGYADFINGVANPPHDNFVIVDNVVVTGFAAPPLPRWTADADGGWSNAANWEGGVPNGAGAPARFLDDITTPRTITNDARHTVGSILFDSEHGYTIVGGAGLTLENTAGEPARITVLRGSHSILNPTPVSSDLVIDVQSPAVPNGPTRLTVRSLPAGGRKVTKTGGSTLEVRSLEAADLEINEGTVAVTPGQTQFSRVAVNRLSLAGTADAWTATLDLADSVLRITPEAATREEVLRRTMNQVKSARNAVAGRWKGPGITSSVAAENPLTGIAVAVVGDQVVAEYTYNGDANLDGTITSDDYFRIDSGFLAQPGNPTYDQGDFNYDGSITSDDYFLIDSAFLGQTGTLGAPIAATVVPEPATVMTVAWLAVGGMLRRRRRR